MEENKFIAYGKDDLTFSLNLQENKSEDWMADWSGRVVVEGKTYFLNGYIKKDGWIAGKLKPEGGGKISEKPRDEENKPLPRETNNFDPDDIPF